MPVTDEEAAIAAISTLNDLSPEQQAAKVKIDRILKDESEPHVDIHELFTLYNTLYFRSLLLPRVEVSWSKRLTVCAGMCELVKDSSGKYTRIRLKLSESLLKYRPRSDTVNTLLHEAIHAYFFITTGWRHSRGDDGTGHCTGFLLLADAINSHGSYKITVFHAFHDEVESYRTHVWQCDGPCRQRPPHFGLVKRTMNRPPSKSDFWWQRHQEECGGNYTKIGEPALTKAQREKMSAKERAGRQKNKIDAWVRTGAENATPKPTAEKAVIDLTSKDGQTPAPQSLARNGKRKLSAEDGSNNLVAKMVKLACPICDEQVTEDSINDHLDKEHPP